MVAVLCGSVLAGCADTTIVGSPVAADHAHPVPHLDISPACAHAPATVEQFTGSWMTGSSGAVYFGMDGLAVIQERAVGQRGTWSYQPLSPNGPCVLRMRWTESFVSGMPDRPIEPQSEWVLQPLSVTPTEFNLRSVSRPGSPDTHWWRWK